MTNTTQTIDFPVAFAVTVAPVWVLILGPIVFRLLLGVALWLLPQASPSWALVPQPRQTKSVIHALKAVAYVAVFSLGCTLFPVAIRAWGDYPLWIRDHTAGLSSSGCLIMVVYGFQLVYSPEEPWYVWLHHVSSVVMTGVAITAPSFLKVGDAFIVSLFGATWLWSLSLLYVFHFAFMVYHAASGPAVDPDSPMWGDRARLKLKSNLIAAAPYLWTPTIVVMNVLPIVVAVTHRDLLQTPDLLYAMVLFPIPLSPEMVLTLTALTKLGRKITKQLDASSADADPTSPFLESAGAGGSGKMFLLGVGKSMVLSDADPHCADKKMPSLPVTKVDALCTSPSTRNGPSNGLSSVGAALVTTSFVSEQPTTTYDQWAAMYDADSFEVLGFDSPRVCVDCALQVWPRDEATGLELAGDVTVIDVGCGTGMLGQLLSDHVGEITPTLHGFDLSEKMLQQARARNVYTSLRQADLLSKWPFRANVADLTLCNGVLLYLTEHTCLEEFIRVTKPGGHCVVMIREDNYSFWEGPFNTLEEARQWHKVSSTEPKKNFLHTEDTILYRIHVFRVLAPASPPEIRVPRNISSITQV